MGAGRPTKLTPELVEQTRALARQGLPLGIICANLGIDPSTGHRWIKDAKDTGGECPELKLQFCKAIHESSMALAKRHINNLNDQSDNGSTHAATWMLTHHPATRDHFSDGAATRREIFNVLNMVGQVIQRSELTPEQQDRLLLQMQAVGLGTPAF